MKRAILGLLVGAGVVTLAVCLLDRRGEVMAQHVVPIFAAQLRNPFAAAS